MAKELKEKKNSDPLTKVVAKYFGACKAAKVVATTKNGKIEYNGRVSETPQSANLNAYVTPPNDVFNNVNMEVYDGDKFIGFAVRYASLIVMPAHYLESVTGPSLQIRHYWNYRKQFTSTTVHVKDVHRFPDLKNSGQLEGAPAQMDIIAFKVNWTTKAAPVGFAYDEQLTPCYVRVIERNPNGNNICYFPAFCEHDFHSAILHQGDKL